MDGVLLGRSDRPEDHVGVAELVLESSERIGAVGEVDTAELLADPVGVSVERPSMTLQEVGKALADVVDTEHRLVGNLVQTNPESEVVRLE